MDERMMSKSRGCGQIMLITVMFLWLGLAPMGVMLLLNTLLGDVVTPGTMEIIVVVANAWLLLAPFVSVTLLARRRTGWEVTAASAGGLSIGAGYLVLDAAVRAVLPPGGAALVSLGDRLLVSVMRLGLLGPYVLLAAWLVSRLVGEDQGSLRTWLGLGRLSLTTLLLAVAAAALVALPWPLTGALGDSLTSLGIVVQVLVQVALEVVVFWGLIFYLLTSVFDRAWLAALMTVLLYALCALGRVLPDADWSVLSGVVFLLPLALLLTEVRARGSGVYPLLPLAFCYRVLPSLFVDPRDALAQGIPEIQHLVSYVVVMAAAALLAVVLWGGRRLLLSRRAWQGPRDRTWLVAVAVMALSMWGVWGGIYIFAGEPGFTNDGFLIILEDQADLSGARDVSEQEARLQYVYETLVETANSRQTDLCAELRALNVPYRSYYIVNMIRVDGHRWLMRWFEGRPGVAQVIRNPNTREYPRRLPFPHSLDDGSVEEIQSNLKAVHADDAWALGVTGEGIVVAGQDTGYDWSHPALKSHYRGWDGRVADHDYNWHDAWDDAAEPFDDGSHGTHTMGIVLGDDGMSNRTGVAPDARWIGCRNMRRGFGNPAAYAECMEFFLAPYPHGGDPFIDGDVRMAPRIVNNSWGCPDFEGCSSDTLKPAVQALRAAGIMMVVSAGNEGPACGTATTPPANYDAVFSVGATSDNGRIVSFSSRGPVDGLIKPDVAAPGMSVRSSVPGGEYGYADGTSMAGPHVAGLAALLWSANPALVGDVDATEALICRTAAPRPVEDLCTAEDEVPEGQFAPLLSDAVCACGDVIGVPNNVYGCGLIDAGAAVRRVLGQ